MKATLLSACLALTVTLANHQPSAAAHMPLSARQTLIRHVCALVNHDREQAGLSPLSLNRRLSRAAQIHSIDMASQHYFAHDAPTGASPYDRIAAMGIHYHLAGENIGTGSGSNRKVTVQFLNAMMLQSPPHRANLLSSAFRFLGVGVALAGHVLYLTEDFTG